MQEDEYGFLYPQIDENKCVRAEHVKKFVHIRMDK